MESAESVVNEVVNPSSAPEPSPTSPAPAAAPAPSEPITEEKAAAVKDPYGSAEKEKPAAAAIDNAYKPSFKVKAYDKEYDIPEKFRGYINKDNEKDFKDVFEKAFAVDEMKVKNNKFREESTQTKQLNSQLVNRFNQLGRFIDNKDYDSFFKEAAIPEQELQRWMLAKLQMKDLPPEQQQVYNSQQELRNRTYQLETENQRLKSEYEQSQVERQNHVVSQRHNELDGMISRPEIDAVAKNFDSRLGQPGAFKQEVINRAAFVSQTTGRDMSVEEAVKEVLKIVAWNTQNNSSDNVVSQPGLQTTHKPTLPNVAGKATSPAAQKVKSIDDLRKLRTSVLKSENGSF